MAILAVIVASLCAFVWHGLQAYPSCSRAEAVKTREDAIVHAIKIWDDRSNSAVPAEDYEQPFLEIIRSEDFHRVSSRNWIVAAEPMFLANTSWYVRYWDLDRHMSVATEFDRCSKPVKDEYHPVYDTIARYLP